MPWSIHIISIDRSDLGWSLLVSGPCWAGHAQRTISSVPSELGRRLPPSMEFYRTGQASRGSAWTTNSQGELISGRQQGLFWLITGTLERAMCRSLESFGPAAGEKGFGLNEASDDLAVLSAKTGVIHTPPGTRAGFGKRRG